jgi:hypothetical protein
MARGQLGQIVQETSISKITRAKWTGSMAQEEERLLCKYATLSSNPSPPPKKIFCTSEILFPHIYSYSSRPLSSTSWGIQSPNYTTVLGSFHWSQDLTHARQALCPWATAPLPAWSLSHLFPSLLIPWVPWSSTLSTSLLPLVPPCVLIQMVREQLWLKVYVLLTI